MTLATIFYHPIVLPFAQNMWLMIPLLISVATIYRTVRSETLDGLPLRIASLVVYMLLGLIALGLCLFLLHEYWPFDPR